MTAEWLQTQSAWRVKHAKLVQGMHGAAGSCGLTVLCDVPLHRQPTQAINMQQTPLANLQTSMRDVCRQPRMMQTVSDLCPLTRDHETSMLRACRTASRTATRRVALFKRPNTTSMIDTWQAMGPQRHIVTVRLSGTNDQFELLSSSCTLAVRMVAA